MLDDRVRAVLARLEEEDDAEQEAGLRPSERSLAVGRDSGRLLFALVAPNAGCEVLEIGGSRGYSAIWLAAAARILGGRVVSLEQDERNWDSVVNTNLKGVWLVAQAAARRMIENKVKGSIVNIASILGLRVAGAVAPYAISKAGVIQMTKALALEWARYGIRVNALAPGYFVTELNDDFFQSDAGQALIKRVPQRRLGQLSELDGPLLLLISNAGSFMTGSVVTVDGGHMVSGL